MGRPDHVALGFIQKDNHAMNMVGVLLTSHGRMARLPEDRDATCPATALRSEPLLIQSRTLSAHQARIPVFPQQHVLTQVRFLQGH